MGIPVSRRPSVYSVKEMRMELSQCKPLCPSSRAAVIVTVMGRILVKCSSDFACRLGDDCNGVMNPGLRSLNIVQKGDGRSWASGSILC